MTLAPDRMTRGEVLREVAACVQRLSDVITSLEMRPDSHAPLVAVGVLKTRVAQLIDLEQMRRLTRRLEHRP